MKDRLKQIIQSGKAAGNSGDLTFYEFGLNKNTHYDILVVASGWTPTKIMPTDGLEITRTAVHSYISGYEVRGHGLTIAWIQCSSGASSIVDKLSICCALDFDKLVFVGAVGGLRKGFEVGDVCSPSFCVAGNLANGYLMESIADYQPFQKVFPNDELFVQQVIAMAAQLTIPVKRAGVFCTDSIFCEYAHLDFIKSFDVDLIEMETSTFYLMAELMEKPAVALLVVSDNLATEEPLLNMPENQRTSYNRGRKELIPQLILGIGKMQHKL